MLIKGTRFWPVLRENLGNIYREIKVALTPIPHPEKWLFIVGCYNSGTSFFIRPLGGLRKDGSYSKPHYYIYKR